MALRRTVVEEGNTLCELYVDTCSDVSDDSENEVLDIHSDVPTNSLRIILQPSAVVFTNDSDASTEVEESSELESSDGKTSDVWSKNDKIPNHEPFLETTDLKIVINNPESVVKVVSSITGDDTVQLLTE